MIPKIVYLFFMLTAGLTSTAQELQVRQQLVGDWIYFTLEYSETTSESDKNEIREANKNNKNLVISFHADGSYMIWDKTEGKKYPLAKGKLELSKKGKHLKIEGLEGDIEKLDATILKLTGPDRPIMVFKKLKP